MKRNMRYYILFIPFAAICVFTSCSEMTTKDYEDNHELTKLLSIRLSYRGLNPIKHGEEVSVMEKGVCYLPTEDCKDPLIRTRTTFSHHDVEVVLQELSFAIRGTHYPRAVLVLESYTNKKLFLVGPGDGIIKKY